METSEHNLCCVVCNKKYTKKSSLDRHNILCDFKMKTKREQQIDIEELGDIPNHVQLVKIVQELTLKLIKMEEKMDEMTKFIAKKKRKLNVIMWLNNSVNPTIGFLEWINTYIKVKPEHFENLMENTIFDTMQTIFEDNLQHDSDFIYPIRCFSQKVGVFYICEKKEDGSAEWRQLVLPDMVAILKKVQNDIITELIKWKTANQHRFHDEVKISIIFNKAVLKLMNISFTQDNNFSRIKNGLYNYLKIDLKSEVEFDFS